MVLGWFKKVNHRDTEEVGEVRTGGTVAQDNYCWCPRNSVSPEFPAWRLNAIFKER